MISESFAVDYTVGRNFVFRIDYTSKSYLQSFSLKSPTGTIYTQLIYDDVAKVATFKLPQADVIESTKRKKFYPKIGHILKL